MITIRPNPEAMVYNRFPCIPSFKVDLYQSLQNKARAREELTNQTAITTLRWIKWESKINAFLTDPFCVMAAGNGVLIYTATALSTITFSTLLFLALGCAFGCIGGALCGLALARKEMLLHLSADHSQQAAEADAHIRELTAHPERGLRLAQPVAFA